MKLALDAMGGDLAPQAPVHGALKALEKGGKDLKIILVGHEDAIRAQISIPIPDNLEICHAPDVVSMSDRSSRVLKSKPNSSLVKGIKLVKDGFADGFISAGPTGAVVATSLLTVGRTKYVKRPALGAYIQTSTGGKILCDVGANPNVKPHHMLQFGIMAALYLDHVEGVKNPKIGLVNIGQESNKGSDLYVETYQLLKQELPTFIGNVEGRDIFTTEADVIICDGFVGNILLKFAEGWTSIFGDMIREKISTKFRYKVGAAFLKPALEEIRNQYDYEEHGGTPLLGLNSVFIVAHGSSGPKAIMNSILLGQKCVNESLVENISQDLSKHLEFIS